MSQKTDTKTLKKDLEITSKTRLAFATGEIGDNVAYQTFSFLIFTFYFTVVGLSVNLIVIGFVIWSLWNAFNDPLIGYLSDRTKHRLGRRAPWMILATIPLAVLMVLLFMPPSYLGSDSITFVYFLITLIAFDVFYSMFNLNYNALFGEMFIEMEDRAETGRLRGMFVSISLILAIVLPTILIEDLTNKRGLSKTPDEYILSGIIAACIIVITYLITLKWGVRNPKEFTKDHENSKSFIETLKFTFKNRAFLIFLIPALATWMCIGLLPTVIPLFATFVLQVTEENSILTGVLLLAAFLAAGISMPLWAKIRKNKGARISGIVAMIAWAIPLMVFIYMPDFTSGLIVMIFAGIGVGGCIYFYDQCLAEIIDEDEIKYGTRRAGSYYGIINFTIRLSVIINFVIIGVLFTSADWQEYTPNPGIDVANILRFLVGWLPLILFTIGAIGLYFYPIHGKRLEDNRKKLTELHATKRERSV